MPIDKVHKTFSWRCTNTEEGAKAVQFLVAQQKVMEECGLMDVTIKVRRCGVRGVERSVRDAGLGARGKPSAPIDCSGAVQGSLTHQRRRYTVHSLHVPLTVLRPQREGGVVKRCTLRPLLCR
jgi:hypothetical protein